jgi:hypothetical protein
MNKTAQIEICNQIARVTPAAGEPVLSPALSFTATRFAPGGPLGHERVTRVERAFRPDGQGALLVPAGLWALTKGELERAGYQVAVQDRRRLDHRATPSPQALAEARGAEHDFLLAVAREPKGVIEAGGESEGLRLAASLCRLFPSARILIALNGSRRKLQDVRRGLQVGRVRPTGSAPTAGPGRAGDWCAGSGPWPTPTGTPTASSTWSSSPGPCRPSRRRTAGRWPG